MNDQRVTITWRENYIEHVCAVYAVTNEGVEWHLGQSIPTNEVNFEKRRTAEDILFSQLKDAGFTNVNLLYKRDVK